MLSTRWNWIFVCVCAPWALLELAFIVALGVTPLRIVATLSLTAACVINLWAIRDTRRTR